MFNIFYADCIGREGNCLYLHKAEVTDAASLLDEITLDARKEYICEGGMFYFYKRRARVDILPLDAAVLPLPKSENPL